MKRILYVVDYLLNVGNSVSEILGAITKTVASDSVEQIFYLGANQYDYNGVCAEMINGFQTYRARAGANIFQRIKTRIFLWIYKLLRKSFGKACRKQYFRAVIRAAKPDLIIFFNNEIDPYYIDLCLKRQIDYMVVLYDTILDCPLAYMEASKAVERYAIEHSKGYFVPSFFCENYVKQYQSKQIHSYDLPLLIHKQNVLQAYRHVSELLDFTYFGQLQSFRNVDRIQEILSAIGIKLDVFTGDTCSNHDVFRTHAPITGADLHQAVASSRFLVAFDNSAPFNRYLPSKVYLYVSFTKPIIAFGDNQQSALIDFFKDYPYFYYQNINEPLDGLIAFLRQDFPQGFQEEIYQKYLKYTADIALLPLKHEVNALLEEN